MNPHLTYLLVDLGCIVGPFLFSFHPRLNFYREWKRFLPPCLLTAVFFLVWDGMFTQLGVWRFNPDYVTGLFLAGMPIEEYLFFICVPYACVFTYFAFTLVLPATTPSRLLRGLCAAVAVLFLVIGVVNIHRLYTGTTFLLLGLFLSYLVYRNVRFLRTFLLSFLFILIPFLIANGILTGSLLDRVVVAYNNQENLGLRILTIPIEDLFYAMLLLLLNVYGYERPVTKRSRLTFRSV